MGWLTTIIGWLVLVLLGMNAAAAWSDVGRSSSLSKKWLHAFSGSTSIAAIAILWTRWNWLGIGLAAGTWIGSALIAMVVGRFWLSYLLKTSPDAADVFMRDP